MLEARDRNVKLGLTSREHQKTYTKLSGFSKRKSQLRQRQIIKQCNDVFGALSQRCTIVRQSPWLRSTLFACKPVSNKNFKAQLAAPQKNVQMNVRAFNMLQSEWPSNKDEKAPERVTSSDRFRLFWSYDFIIFNQYLRYGVPCEAARRDTWTRVFPTVSPERDKSSRFQIHVLSSKLSKYAPYYRGAQGPGQRSLRCEP
ncbi:Hypothetical_protein [Hexamita inflata]|uniref:Hypothetical_protein n=1 Tax=Hexamita inflata TaxID=28002 RepID=A0ABP1GHE4_9EUKA